MGIFPYCRVFADWWLRSCRIFFLTERFFLKKSGLNCTDKNWLTERFFFFFLLTFTGTGILMRIDRGWHSRFQKSYSKNFNTNEALVSRSVTSLFIDSNGHYNRSRMTSFASGLGRIVLQVALRMVLNGCHSRVIRPVLSHIYPVVIKTANKA